jgi:hypothetical protein
VTPSSQKTSVLAAVQSVVGPRGLHIGCNTVFATLAADAWTLAPFAAGVVRFA